MPRTLRSLAELRKLVAGRKPSRVCVVTSAKLAKKLRWAIREMGLEKASIAIVPDGEKAKEWKVLEKLLARLAALKLDRQSLIVILGGGTVGDLAGFAASIYLRGIDYVQVPTTLVAQVDSAHGGKTGINFLGAKNQIGTTCAASAVVLEPRFLASLGRNQLVGGLGEIIKAGFVGDPKILALLRKETLAELPRSARLAEIVRRSVVVKQRCVAGDLHDRGNRLLLNFGHTLGHAVEIEHGFSHGRAVIVGMLQELVLAEKLKLTPPSVRKELEALLASLKIKIDASPRGRWAAVRRDKKVAGKLVTLVVIAQPGKARLVKVPLSALRPFCR
ncbi:MAG TPA: 3-dehydroquinate synthase family protein [Candidatus Paceibacterota bacterium]